jgi:hypothetical protein
MLPAQWPPKPLHLWPSSQKHRRSSRLHAHWRRLGRRPSFCLSCVTRHLSWPCPRGIPGLRVSVLPDQTRVQPRMQTRRLTLEYMQPPVDTRPQFKVGIRYSSGAAWSRYLTERQAREHYLLLPCNLDPSKQPDRHIRHSVVGESHQIFVPNSVRRREATRSYHRPISA